QDPGPTAWAAAQWLDWQQRAASFDSIGAYTWSFNFLVRDQGSQSIEGMYATADYFRVVGMQPILGRTFLPAELRPNAAPTIIIGYDLWQRTFNADPSIVGKPLRISRMNTPPTVIGVMPLGERFLPPPDASRAPHQSRDGVVDSRDEQRRPPRAAAATGGRRARAPHRLRQHRRAPPRPRTPAPAGVRDSDRRRRAAQRAGGAGDDRESAARDAWRRARSRSRERDRQSDASRGRACDPAHGCR